MTRVRTRSLLGTGLAAALAVALATPGATSAWSLIGGSLGITATNYQRDVRVFNNAIDSQANDNQLPNNSYPGAFGATQAVWKGAAAWSSHDPLAAKNFDVDFQGDAGGGGGTNGNVVSWGDPGGCGGGVLAFTQTPISDGWKIVFCESGITWNDGPGNISFSHYDIQSVMAHEFGHALGLGHTGVQCSSCSNLSTMCSFICNGQTNQRTISSDDAAGLQAIYGTMPADKPLITGLSGSFAKGGALVIEGSNFPATAHVKFTAGTGVNALPMPGVVENVPSTNGGTRITVTIPSAARTGNVLVWSTAPQRLSNAFPITVEESPWADLGGGTSGVAGPPVLSMGGPLTPASTLSLDLVQGPPSALGLLFLSLSSTPSAFLGGTLHAFPPANMLLVVTDGGGEIHGSAPFAGAPSGAQVFFQIGLDDGTVPVYGASLSNGVVGTVP